MGSHRSRFAVFSTGHAGTTWLSDLFLEVAGVVAFHEPIAHILHTRSLESVLRAPQTSRHLLQPYETWLEHRRREYELFGEIHSGHWEIWSTLTDLVPENRCLVTRHPIQVVHSLSRVILASGDRVQMPEYRGRLPPDVQLSSPAQEIFADACIYWAEQTELAHALAPLPSYRLEDLTSQPATLQAFIAERAGIEVPPGSCEEFGRDVRNRKVQGDRSPENIFWNIWSDFERELFQRLVSDAMTELGYAIPPATSAPETTPETGRTALRLGEEPGSLRSAWVFNMNPLPRVVLVYGGGARALAAAELMGEHQALLVRSKGVDIADEPPGLDVVGIEDTPIVRAHGIFVTHPEPEEAEVERLLELNPDAELIFAEPPLPAEQYAVPEPRTPHRGKTILGQYGPLYRGQRLSGEWHIAELLATRESLQICVADDRGNAIDIELKPGPFDSPFRVGDGYVEYRRTEVPYEQFGGAIKRLAKVLDDNLGGAGVADAMQRWYRDAVAASMTRSPAG